MPFEPSKRIAWVARPQPAGVACAKSIEVPFWIEPVEVVGKFVVLAVFATRAYALPDGSASFARSSPGSYFTNTPERRALARLPDRVTVKGPAPLTELTVKVSGLAPSGSIVT